MVTHNLSKSDLESTLHIPLAEPLPQIVLEPFATGPGWYLWINGEIVGATASDKFIDSVKDILAQGSVYRAARGRK